MKSNPLLNDIAKGLWAMSFDGLAFWAPFAQKLMSGEKTVLNLDAANLLNVFDNKGNQLTCDENGNYNPPKGSVAVVNIAGALIKFGDWCTYGALDIVNALKKADDNPNIIGTVAYFDGPGGSVSAIPPFLDFAKTKKKPIVGLYDQCCSAHLYAMLSISDYVMAENDLSATIGSVGIVMSFVDNREYLKKMGYVVHEIYPEESETKNEAFRLALEGKYDLIKKEMLSPLAIKFQNAVKTARPNLKNEPGVLTGKTFFTDQAIAIKLIDREGNMQEAIEMVKILSETSSLYK